MNHTAKECEGHCQYSVDVGMWPQHSCSPVCMYLSKPNGEETKMAVNLSFVDGEGETLLYKKEVEYVPRINDEITIDRHGNPVYVVYAVRWLVGQNWATPTVTVYLKLAT